MRKEISIHVPARGATRTMAVATFRRSISIHAPARGATGITSMINGYSNYFNPRSRKGSDVSKLKKYRFRRISIHAPARGATLFGQQQP